MDLLERWLLGRRRAERSYSTFKVRSGGSEEIYLVQGMEKWLHFAGCIFRNKLPDRIIRCTV